MINISVRVNKYLAKYHITMDDVFTSVNSITQKMTEK